MRKKILKFKKFELLEILFLDTISNDAGWRRLKDFDFKEHTNAMDHKICGFFVHANGKALCTCRSFALDNEEKMIDIWSIPLGAIIKIRRLK